MKMSVRESLGATVRVLKLYWSVVLGVLLLSVMFVSLQMHLRTSNGHKVTIAVREDLWAKNALPLPLKLGHNLKEKILIQNSTQKNTQKTTYPERTTNSTNSKDTIPINIQRNPPNPSWIFAITPTYVRTSQKVDLTSLCQTLMNIPDLIWIVIEDSDQRTDLVSRLLMRCSVWTVHLNVPTSGTWPLSRGVEQRNLGLSWIRMFCKDLGNCTGAMYFMDDDNKYDLRLFEEIRKTRHVSVWPVAFLGGSPMEGPLCVDGRVNKWVSFNHNNRLFPIDMAGFAVNIEQILTKPEAMIGYDTNGNIWTWTGWLETLFLENFVRNLTDPKLECSGSTTEVFAWHVKTREPVINKVMDNYGFET